MPPRLVLSLALLALLALLATPAGARRRGSAHAKPSKAYWKRLADKWSAKLPSPPETAGCFRDGFGHCVEAALQAKICAFNTMVNGDRATYDRMSYGRFRKAMNEHGLGRRDGVEVDVGHIIPDPSKKTSKDEEDYGCGCPPP